jgi:hypothetical protein
MMTMMTRMKMMMTRMTKSRMMILIMRRIVVQEKETTMIIKKN